MNLLCKERICARTKSLREKFSRNRSYSELSFKDQSASSLSISVSPNFPITTPNNNIRHQNSRRSGLIFDNDNENQHSYNGGISKIASNETSGQCPPARVSATAATSPYHYQNDPYCSALDLCFAQIGGLVEEPPRFPWQRDIAIQCELIKIPIKLPINSPILPTTTTMMMGVSNQTKKISSSLLMARSNQKLRTESSSLGKNSKKTLNQISTDGGQISGGKSVWKETLMLPATATINASNSSNNNNRKRQQKSFKWSATASMIRRNPMLKRTVSFDSRKGYAKLVQSFSSPSSPTESNIINDVDHPSFYQPIASDFASHLTFPETTIQINSPESHVLDVANGVELNQKAGSKALSTTSSSASSSLSLSFRELSKQPNNKENLSNYFKRVSPEMSMQELRREQFMKSRKQPSSAPDSFDDDSLSIKDSRPLSNCGTVTHQCGTENELYNFNTMNRLLDISLRASEQQSCSVILSDSNSNDGSTMASQQPMGQQNHPASIKSLLLDIPDGTNSSYQTLPSPNVQSEIQEVNPMLRKLSVLSRAPHKALTVCLSDSTDKKRRKYDFDKQIEINFNTVDNDLEIDDSIEYEALHDGGGGDESPPVEALLRRSRRRALVPPKLITDGYESCNEFEQTTQRTSNKLNDQNHHSDDGLQSKSLNLIQLEDDRLEKSPTNFESSDRQKHHHHHHHHHHHCQNDQFKSKGFGNRESQTIATTTTTAASPTNHKNNRRRSSVAVIPPMQICPGDLLVYSKVLSQRSNMIEDSLSSGLLSDGEQSRKSHKNTWSLLRLFDRSNSRSKAAADQVLCGLEEVLVNLQPSNSFVDESMSRYRAISWNDFLTKIEQNIERQRKVRVKKKNQNSEEDQDHRTNVSSSSSLIVSASMAAAATAVATAAVKTDANLNTSDGDGESRFVNGTRFNSLQPSMAGRIGHACKKVSLSCPSEPKCQPMSSNMGIKRTPSNDTVSDVESLLENDTNVSRKSLNSIRDGSRDDYDNEDDDKFDDRSVTTTMTTTSTHSENCCQDCLVIIKRERKRREALWDLFQSDLLFLMEHLIVLKNVYMEPLKNIQVEGYAMYAEPEVLFGNLDELCLVIYAFCRDFLNVLTQQATSGGDINVIEVLSKLYQQSGRASAMHQAYHRYTLNYINALTYLETLRRQIEFIEYEKWCNRDPRCKKLQLTDLLVAPVQHVMRVPLLLKEIKNLTTEQTEKEVINRIIEDQENSLRELDDKMRWLKNFECLLEIQRNIVWPSVIDLDPKVFIPDFLKGLLNKQPCERLIVSPQRQIILEGPLMVLDSGKPIEMYVFLFDDLLLITRRKKGLGKKQSTLTERWVSNCSGRNSSFSSVVSSTGGNANNSVPSNQGTLGGSTNSGSISSSSHAVNSSSMMTSNATTAAAASASLPTTTTVPSDVIAHGSFSAPGSGSMSCGGGVGGGGGCYKYIVYKQPLSLDRFYVHDVQPMAEGAANLKNCFVLVCLNRFQQVITVHTFQASSESSKNVWLLKLRNTCDRWKRALQNNAFRGLSSMTNTSKNSTGNRNSQRHTNLFMANDKSGQKSSIPSQQNHNHRSAKKTNFSDHQETSSDHNSTDGAMKNDAIPTQQQLPPPMMMVNDGSKNNSVCSSSSLRQNVSYLLDLEQSFSSSSCSSSKTNQQKT